MENSSRDEKVSKRPVNSIKNGFKIKDSQEGSLYAS